MTKNQLIAVGIVAILLAIGANTVFAVRAFDKSETSIVINCKEIEVVKTALRETIEQSANFTSSSPVRSKNEKSEAEIFYNEVLSRFKARNCESGKLKAESKGKHARTSPKSPHKKQ